LLDGILQELEVREWQHRVQEISALGLWCWHRISPQGDKGDEAKDGATAKHGG
jgi:hypothetical protein